jgi:dCMP deaminase
MEQDYRSKRNEQIDQTFMSIATNISMLSHCTKYKVGSIIVNPSDGNIIATGFNGMPTGFDNTAETLVEGKLVTNPAVIHSEANCIAKVARSVVSSNGGTMYCTLSCCFDCAKLIIMCGIKRFVYKDDYKDPSGLELLREAGVVVEKIKQN